MHQLILIRHAETQANAERRWQGQRHEGVLTPRGRSQIERTAQRLWAERDEIVALYTSPLGRARETAQGIGKVIGLDPVIHDNLTEMDFGELDSWTMAEIIAKRPAFFAAWQDLADSELAWPGGERRRDFWQRVTGSFDQILERHPEGSIVVIGHGGSLRAGIGYLLDWPPALAMSYNLFNCSLTRLVYEFDRWRLLTLNDFHHLDNAADSP